MPPSRCIKSSLKQLDTEPRHAAANHFIHTHPTAHATVHTTTHTTAHTSAHTSAHTITYIIARTVGQHIDRVYHPLFELLMKARIIEYLVGMYKVIHGSMPCLSVKYCMRGFSVKCVPNESLNIVRPHGLCARDWI